MTKEIQLTRFIPFLIPTTEVQNKDAEELLSLFRFDVWDVSKSLNPFLDMTQIAARFEENGVDSRNFPFLFEKSGIKTGTKSVTDSKTGETVQINYLATIIFGLIEASRRLISEDNKLQASIWTNQISSFLDAIIEIESVDEDHISVIANYLNTAQRMLIALAPQQMKDYNKNLREVSIVDENEKSVDFKLVQDIDLEIEQSIYLYHTRIGFIVNKITIHGLSELNPSLVSSIDLMHRLCKGGFRYNIEANFRELASRLKKTFPGENVPTIGAISHHFDIISVDFDVEMTDVDIRSLILSNPLIDIYDSSLKGDLFFAKSKKADELIAQADFRTSLKNAGSFRKKIDIAQTLNFIYLQVFHEKLQTSQFLDIYRQLWQRWHRDLTTALSWDTLKIVRGGMSQLGSIYREVNRLELFFASEFSDLNVHVKVEELAETLTYHIYFADLIDEEVTLIPEDFIAGESDLKPDRLEVLNFESSYLEYIDTHEFMKAISQGIGIEDEYSTFRNLQDDLEKMLDSVQDISQTKQQRWITIAIVIFSISELFLGFFDAFFK